MGESPNTSEDQPHQILQQATPNQTEDTTNKNNKEYTGNKLK